MYNQSRIKLPQHITDFSISSTNIIQWNIYEIANKKTKLVDLIAKEKPGVLRIQKNYAIKETKFNLKNYNGLFKEGHTNYQAHGEVAIFIHEIISYQKL